MIFNKFTQFELALFQMVSKEYPEKVRGHFQNFCFKQVDHLAMALLAAKPTYSVPVDTIHLILSDDIKMDVLQFYQHITACFTNLKCLSLNMMCSNFHQIGQI